MAPIPLTLIHRTTKSYSHSNSSSSAGGIGGGVVAAIIVIALIIFICVFIHEYNKAKRLEAEKGIPISKGKIFKKAALTALTFGFVLCLCAECCNGSNTGNSGSGGGNAQSNNAAPQMDQTDGGFVSPPMPTYQPQLDMTPITIEAQDQIQG